MFDISIGLPHPKKGEDKYTLLAYQSLLMLEDYYRRCLNLYNIMPSPGVVKMDGELV